MTCPLELSSDARLFLLDDQGVVFSEASKDLYALNSTATFIWCCAEEGLAEDEIAARIADTLGIPSADARAQLDAIRDQWAGLGLLAASPRTAGPADAGVGTAATPGTAARADGLAPYRVHAERRYRILSQRFRVRYSAAGQDELVHPLIAHLAADEADGPESVLDVVADGAGYALILDGMASGRADSIGQLAPTASALLFNTAVEREPYLLGIHAAAVGAGGRALLLPGEAGRGKTSLTAALVRAGFRYLTDDVCLLDEETLEIRGVPTSLCIKDTGRELLARFHPALADLPIHDRVDGKRVCYLPPPGEGRAGEGYPIEWIVFPRYEPGAVSALRPLPRAEAFCRLVSHGAAGEAWDAGKVARLVDWAARPACFELPVSSLDDAVAVLRDLCEAR